MLRLYAYIHSSSRTACRLLHTTLAANVSPEAIASGSSGKWTPNSIRTGVIARKRGMTAMWDDHGARFPVTVLQVSRSLLCYVVSHVTLSTDHHSLRTAR